ncbi:wall-associated protein [Luteibacter anthropi]|uniref:RHS repeat-associated core domain-containing protein n=1 Tax=Luteibacter anthropi TaxID=564369 RepID=UPI0020326947|nr:RHS repeat-associated core domain-containing protein [Luteibacter anthropi]URX61664.1 wall-associated protein [Luteibacter anthropi]
MYREARHRFGARWWLGCILFILACVASGSALAAGAANCQIVVNSPSAGGVYKTSDSLSIQGTVKCSPRILFILQVALDGHPIDVNGDEAFSAPLPHLSAGNHLVTVTATGDGAPGGGSKQFSFNVIDVASGSISAAPVICNIPVNSATCSTTISWNSNRYGDLSQNSVIVTDLNNNGAQTFYGWNGNQSNSAQASWISSTGFRFHLRGNREDNDLATVDVRGNLPPSVTLTAPGNGGVYYDASSSIVTTAVASDPDGSIDRVEFYGDGNLLGAVRSPPYQLAWTPGTGSHRIDVLAVDNLGNTAWSNRSNLVVYNSTVVGNIDGVTPDGIVTGWACSTYWSSSINVDLYLGGAFGSGTGIGRYVANQASDASVAGACNVAGGSYRFSIQLTEAQRIQYAGAGIYIHGISPTGKSNNLLNGSGNLAVPAAVPNAQFVGQSVAGSMTTGTTQTVTIQLKNSGTRTWTSAANFRLGSQNPGDNHIWGLGRVVLSGDVAPGQIATFTFPITAPAAPGTYNFQWRMVQEGVTWFGDLTPNLAINVSVPPPPPPPPVNPQTRRYVYNENHEVCKVIEPETGATVMEYDAAGNLSWSASGLNLPDPNSCNYQEAFASQRVVGRMYDERNRLKTLSFPDHNGDQDWTYWPDGRPRTITTQNEGGTKTAINSYEYDPRRLLTKETLSEPDGRNWSISYDIDAYGHQAGITSPDSFHTSYAPNALGQPSVVNSSWGTLASAISYYPNGAIKSFVYGNGIQHTMVQDLRQLPERSIDGNVLDLETSFDADGNVDHIYDNIQGSNYNRQMAYDGLDRMYRACSPMFGGTDGCHRYTYDALDNLRAWQLSGVKDYATYYYDATNRLSNIQNSGGGTIVGLSYDVQGNLANKNGQTYQFDYGNRLRAAPGREGYRYDGYGRRIAAEAPDGAILSQYSLDGRLIYEQDNRRKLNKPHFYLGAHLLAVIEWNTATQSWITKYQHTDALGSPVAVTDSAGQVIERTNYEPYGQPTGKPSYQGVGYAGHVMDEATGLSYMQQRYYDPGIGRFLSRDPVTADANTGANFNAYWYANNNPYRFTDPDGRESVGELINSGAEGCGPVSCAGWATLHAAWMVFGAESVSQISSNGWSNANQSDMAGASMELASALPPVKFGRAAVPLLRGGSKMVRLGQEGEHAVRAAFDIGKKEEIVVNGVKRIPDGITDTTINEVKNVASLSYTSQLRDYAQFAKDTGREFNLFVRPGAKLTGTLEKAAAAGDINIHEIPFK